MNKIVQYIIVSAYDADSLEQKVNEYLLSSTYPEYWQPVGGISVLRSNNNGPRYHQAIMKVDVR